MNVPRTALLAPVTVAFLGLTGYVGWVYGPIDWFWPLWANPATVLVTVDLILALSMLGGWIWVDARKRGISPAPYLAVMVLTGSAGGLLYLLRRERAA